MFTTKYRPNKLADFIGNYQNRITFAKWLLEWKPTLKKKGILISGLNGIGKSLLVDLVLHKYDFHIIHFDGREKEYITQTIKPLLKITHTFNGQQNVLVVSDIDSGGDYGFLSSLTECLKETEIPIICICDDRYDQNIKTVTGLCQDIKMSKPTYKEVYPLIYEIVTRENIKMSKTMVDKLYEESNGDIRFILNTLQIGLGKGSREKTKKDFQSANIFDTTGKLLMQSTDMSEKYNLYWMGHDIHTLMIHENYIANSIRKSGNPMEEITYSADSLSDTDLFDTNFQNEMKPYIAMSTIRATTKCSKKGQIKFTQFLGKKSTMNKNKREKMDYNNRIFKFC